MVLLSASLVLLTQLPAVSGEILIDALALERPALVAVDGGFVLLWNSTGGTLVARFDALALRHSRQEVESGSAAEPALPQLAADSTGTRALGRHAGANGPEGLLLSLDRPGITDIALVRDARCLARSGTGFVSAFFGDGGTRQLLYEEFNRDGARMTSQPAREPWAFAGEGPSRLECFPFGGLVAFAGFGKTRPAELLIYRHQGGAIDAGVPLLGDDFALAARPPVLLSMLSSSGAGPSLRYVLSDLSRGTVVQQPLPTGAVSAFTAAAASDGFWLSWVEAAEPGVTVARISLDGGEPLLTRVGRSATSPRPVWMTSAFSGSVGLLVLAVPRQGGYVLTARWLGVEDAGIVDPPQWPQTEADLGPRSLHVGFGCTAPRSSFAWVGWVALIVLAGHRRVRRE